MMRFLHRYGDAARSIVYYAFYPFSVPLERAVELVETEISVGLPNEACEELPENGNEDSSQDSRLDSAYFYVAATAHRHWRSVLVARLVEIEGSDSVAVYYVRGNEHYPVTDTARRISPDRPDVRSVANGPRVERLAERMGENLLSRLRESQEV